MYEGNETNITESQNIETETMQQPEVDNVAQQMTYEEPAQEPVKTPKEKKRPNAFVRGVKFVVAALLFGVIAGAAIYGICYIGGKTLPIPGTQQTQSSTDRLPVINMNEAVSNNTETGDEVTTPVLNVKAIVKADMPAMVAISGSITSTSIYGQTSSKFGELGTGVIIGQNDTELFIVTNAHVVEDVKDLTATFVDGTTAPLTLQGMKNSADIAVVSVSKADMSEDTASAISIIKIGNSDEVEVGDPVVVIGNALGKGQSVTVGYISALNRQLTIESRTYENLFLTDAAINSGNSGGALINANGELIGINSAKANSAIADSMGYAIPISYVKDIIDKLIANVDRQEVSADKACYLGIRCQDVTAAISSYYGYPQGVFLTDVIENSPAYEAGLEINDIIVGFDDTTISCYDDLSKIMKYYEAGEQVEIEYYHYENKAYVLNKTTITLGSAKDNIS